MKTNNNHLKQVINLLPSRNNLIIWLVLIAIVLVRINAIEPVYKEGDHIRLSGKVKVEPVKYSYSQGFKLHGLSMYLPIYPEIKYGDEIIVEGVYTEDSLSEPILIKLEKTHNPIYRLRNKIIGIYERSLPLDMAGLTSGMVIGSKKLISNQFWEKLKLTGTAHVVVASGMNVTLVSGFLMKILVVFMNRKYAILLALIGIWLYAVIAGFDAPIVRAAIMGSIGLSAVAAGRLKTAWRSLIMSAIFMLIIWPDWISDLGFILSFVATGSIIAFERPLSKRIEFVPNFVRQDLSTSLSAQIGVMPILFFSFGQFNILSPLINVLILWTVVPITIIGIIGAMVGLVIEPAGRLILYLNYPLATWFLCIVEIFS